MGVKEGMRRIVWLISLCAALWLIACLLLVLVQLIWRNGDGFTALTLFVVGCIGFFSINAVAWVVAGFSGMPGTSGLIILRMPNRRTSASMPSSTKVVGLTPSGVGGWLLFLIVGLILIGPLFVVAELVLEISNLERSYSYLQSIATWHTYKTARWCVVLTDSAISISAGFRLWKSRDVDAPRFAMVCIWVIKVVPIFATYAVYRCLAESPAARFFERNVVPELAVSILSASMWTLYLRSSRRVKNTYNSRLSCGS